MTRPDGSAASAAGPAGDAAPAPRPGRLPFVVYALAACTFLMLTTEFLVAGLLPEIAGDLHVSVARAGLMITVFAVGMIVGAPAMALLTRRMPRRVVLMLALAVFAAGHVAVALGFSFPLLLAARFVTAWATGAFWSVAFVVAGRAAGPAASSRAVGMVGAGGMLANVVGVPLGALAGQISGWRGPFWALAVLAAVAVALIARSVPADSAHEQSVPIRAELTPLRSGRLWLVLAACATTTGGVLSAYSYISPLLTDRAGIATGLVPLVLVGFGVGTLIGTVLGGRLGDHHPHAITIAVPAATAVALAAVGLLSAHAVPAIALVVLLGLVGLSANPVLTSFAVRSAAAAATLGSSLSVAAFNAGTAVGSWSAGLTLGSTLGAVGPVVVGSGFAALTLIPAIALARVKRRHGAVDMGAPAQDAAPSCGLAA
jgi:predicted MFS family arabinose efflux permease